MQITKPEEAYEPIRRGRKEERWLVNAFNKNICPVN
jgi:hypothetical protein